MKTGAEAKAARLKRGINQSKFWGVVGVTQSAGSRYESGRNLPPPVQKLLLIAHGKPNVSAKIVSIMRNGRID